MKYVLCGLPEDNLRNDISSLYSSAPVSMYPPLAYFSKVLDAQQVFTTKSPWSLSSGPPFEPLKLDFTFVNFRHVYNTSTGFSEFVASLSVDSVWVAEANRELGIALEDATFPYMLIMKDGMQSSKTKSFCLSVSNYLANKPVTFLVNPTSMSNVVSNFSPNVQHAFER